MTYVKITDKDGKPIDNSNPLPVVTDIQIGAVTATDVTIKDPVTPTNKLAVNADGSINVQLTGRNVETIYFFNALAITDTNLKASTKQSLNKYGKFFLVAISSLNQPVKVTIRLEGTTTTYRWDGTSWQGYSLSGSGRSVDIPASSGGRFLLNTFFTELNNQAIDSMDILAQCSVAPTSGSLTVLAWGVPN